MNTATLRKTFPNISDSCLAENASEGVAGDSVPLRATPNNLGKATICAIAANKRVREKWGTVILDEYPVDSIATNSTNPDCSTIKLTIMGDPIGKPRMTQRDKWAKRPCVLRYREWADKARASAPKDLPQSPNKIIMVAYLPFPKSYKEKKRKELQGKPHRLKPDADNLLKCIDALWTDDSAIWSKHIDKFWDDGLGPRIEIEVTP